MIFNKLIFLHIPKTAGSSIRNSLSDKFKIIYEGTQEDYIKIGLSEKEARAKHGDQITVLRWDFAENDRAKAMGIKDGLIKVITSKKGLILGVSIVGENADELLATWTLAINEGLKIGSMANVISPYPTLGEVSKRAASSYYTESLFSDRTKKIVKWLSFMG